MGAKKSRLILRSAITNACSVVIAVGMLVGVACVSSTPTLAADAQAVSPEVAVHLKEAQKAINRKEWASALAEIDKADALQTRTVYDQYVIDQMRIFVRAHWK